MVYFYDRREQNREMVVHSSSNQLSCVILTLKCLTCGDLSVKIQKE